MDGRANLEFSIFHLLCIGGAKMENKFKNISDKELMEEAMKRAEKHFEKKKKDGKIEPVKQFKSYIG